MKLIIVVIIVVLMAIVLSAGCIDDAFKKAYEAQNLTPTPSPTPVPTLRQVTTEKMVNTPYGEAYCKCVGHVLGDKLVEGECDYVGKGFTIEQLVMDGGDYEQRITRFSDGRVHHWTNYKGKETSYWE
jgi:hypothetical protein